MMATATFPLMEQVLGPITIEPIGDHSVDNDSVRYRITMPAPRIVSLSGLVPLLPFPGHEIGVPSRSCAWCLRSAPVPATGRWATWTLFGKPSGHVCTDCLDKFFPDDE